MERNILLGVGEALHIDHLFFDPVVDGDLVGFDPAIVAELELQWIFEVPVDLGGDLGTGRSALENFRSIDKISSPSHRRYDQ